MDLYEPEYLAYTNFSNETFNKVGLMKSFIASFKKLLLLRTRTVVMMVLAFAVVQKIMTFLILNVLLSHIVLSRTLKSFSIGLFLFTFFVRIRIYLKNGVELFVSRMKIQKKLIDESGKKTFLIDFIEMNMNVPEHLLNHNGGKNDFKEKIDAKTTPEEQILRVLNSLEAIEYNKIFKYGWMLKLVLFFIPIQISFQKVKLILGEHQFYADYISIRLTYNKVTRRCEMNFFIHEFNNYKTLALKNFEFELEADWENDYKNKIFKFNKYSSNLKIANLDLTINSLAPHCKSDYFTEPFDVSKKDEHLISACIQKDQLLQTYSEVFTRVCSFLKVVEFNVEDINLKIPNFHLDFYCASLIMRFNATESLKLETGYEFTLSSNTMTLKIFEDKIISLPLLSIFLVGDSLYDFRDIENFKCNVKCILNCIDCSVVIAEKHIEYFIQNFLKNKNPSLPKNNTATAFDEKIDDEKWSLLLYFFNFFSLDFKFLVPNASFTYLIGNSNITIKNNQSIFHLQSPHNIYHLYDELLGGTAYDYNEELRLTNTLSSIKTSDISVVFNDLVNKTFISNSILSLKKFEIQNYQNNIFQLDCLLLGSDLKVPGIGVLKKLRNAVKSLKNVWKSYCTKPVKADLTNSNKNFKNSTIEKIYFRARVVDSYFVSSFSNVIKKDMDPSGDLYDKYYGFQCFVNNLDFRFHANTKLLTIATINLGLIEKSESIDARVSKAGILENFVIDLADGVNVSLELANLKTELATLWTVFYLTSAYKDAFPASKDKSKVKSKSSTNKFKAKINTLLIDSYLVDDMNVLFSFKYISIKKNFIAIKLIQTFIQSTFNANGLEIEDKGEAFTRLLKVKDSVIDTRKETLVDDICALINVQIFELRSEYHFKFYKIFDKIVSTFKSFKQLKTGFSNLDNFIQNQPSSMNAIAIPVIKINLNKFLVKVDEDPFEHRINLIYKVGLSEQKLRLDKEIMFQEELDKAKNKNKMNESEIAEARYRLEKNFATSWIERMKKAKSEFLNLHAYDSLERKYLNKTVKIYAGHERIPLMVYSLTDMELTIKPPNFGIENFASFIHKYGKGVPMETVYTLLILLNVNLHTKLLRLQLRDYTLPILYFPNMTLQGDLVLGESMPDEFGVREVWVPFIKGCNKDVSNIFGSNVLRTINSIKFYVNLNVFVDSPEPTILTWGKSLQPAIQSVMMWFDFLTKPPLDPSPKIGFWDKIRLLLHGIIKFQWAEESELHLNMKGSTDPYAVHEFGAGLTFCWKGNTSLTIHENSNPVDFLKIRSKNFILGVRNFDSPYKEKMFGKIMMELRGEVLWRLGLMFEAGNLQRAGETRRSSDFIPHYLLYLANPKFLSHPEGHDSYKKFRSSFIHMDIGVYSEDPLLSKNSVHLAPFCSEHFLAWWKLFSTYTSGPIRQGPLFPSMQQSSTKFGRSLFTLKYQMNFVSLEMAHVYRHSSSESTNKDDSIFTGLKGKFDVFKLDLHQKRTPVILDNDLLNISKRVWKLKMDQGEIDFMNADIRLIHSVFNKDSVSNVFSEKSDDFSWYNFLDYTDLDDFKDLVKKPEFLQTIPLLQSERISYFRNIERRVFQVNYPFGNESFHSCLAGKNNSEITQLDIYKKRLDELERSVLNFELGKDCDTKSNLPKPDHDSLKVTFQHLTKQQKIIKDLIKKFEPMRQEIERTYSNVSLGSEDLEMINPIPTLLSKKDEQVASKKSNNKTGFDNKFVIHNLKLKINEQSKNLLLSYAKKLEERKATSFYDSYKSLSILNEILEYSGDILLSGRPSSDGNSTDSSNIFGDVKLNFLQNSDYIKQFEQIIRTISDVNFFSSDNMVLKFIMPQIQLCSNVVEDWAAVVLANEIEVAVIDIIQGSDSALVVKSVENLRETRICMLLSEIKFFALDKENVLSHPSLRYEVADKSDVYERFWIPWLPVESFIDSSCLDQFKIFSKSSMFLSFYNPNELFYDKISHRVYEEDAILRVGVPEMHIQSTSEQYNAIYNIFNDLLTFQSKEIKKWDTLAKTFLADEMKKNFVRSAQFIISLQKKIRAIRSERSIMKANDPVAFMHIRDRVEKELDSDRFELGFLMTSLKKNMISSRKRNKHNELNKVIWYISADDVIWDFYETLDNPFITFGLGFSSFQRTSYSDGSNSNKLMISTLHCFNLDKAARYGELISPFKEKFDKDNNGPLLEVFWQLDKPVGGISQVRFVEIGLRPLKVQLEHLILERIVSFLLFKNDKNGSTNDKLSDKSASRTSFDSRISVDTSSLASPGEQKPTSNKIFMGNSVISPEHGIAEMVKRSNSYMAIKKIVINKTVLCVSYRGSKKLVNLNNLVVKIPVLSYENKIWSVDDVVAALKKDLIKVVLSHTGDIISNKFKKKSTVESKYESFKQFSKLLKADSFIDSGDESDNQSIKLKNSKLNKMSVIEENDVEEENESIKQFY